MNYDLIFAIIFYGFVLLFFLKNKKKFEIQNKIFFLYKTKLGLRFMNKIARIFPRTLNIIKYFSIFTGIGGMLFIFYFLIKSSINLILDPAGPPSIAPVFPGVSIPGAPALSFWHWIIAIFFVAVVHEFAHGIFARLNKIHIKSSGFAFLGPILAAFVEPDEKQMKKLKKKDQLAIFSAGPFSNIVFGILFLLLLACLMPIEGKIVGKDNVIIDSAIEGYPAGDLEIEYPFTILAVNGEQTQNKSQFFEVIKDMKSNENITLLTDKGEFNLTTVEHPNNETKGFIGTAFLQQHPVMDWIKLLLIWLFMINFGVGLFNLLPLGPVDGGRIFYTLTLVFIKNEQKAKKIWGYVSFICLILIFINLLPWIMKILTFISKPILLLISLL